MMNDRSKFGKSMAYLSSMFRHEIDVLLVDLYWNVLKEMSEKDFNTAVEGILKDFQPSNACPFPVPAHFLKYTRSRDYSGVVETVKDMVRRKGSWASVDFQDRALHFVIRCYGGWESVCSWTDDDWKINTKHFIEAYRSAVEHKKAGPIYLSGTTEIENRTAGYGELADKEIPGTVDRELLVSEGKALLPNVDIVKSIE